jgi:predicted nucleic acid-binding protein
MTVVVCDTSVLSYLALIGQLHLLPKLFGHITIPRTVLAECLHPDAPELLRSALTPELPSFAVTLVGGPNLPETASLDPGEAEAISIAWQNRADSLLLIDEKQGRAIATSLGLQVRGLLGLLMEGHRQQFLEFDSAIERLKPLGFRLSEQLIADARRSLGLP